MNKTADPRSDRKRQPPASSPVIMTAAGHVLRSQQCQGMDPRAQTAQESSQSQSPQVPKLHLPTQTTAARRSVGLLKGTAPFSLSALPCCLRDSQPPPIAAQGTPPPGIQGGIPIADGWTDGRTGGGMGGSMGNPLCVMCGLTLPGAACCSSSPYLGRLGPGHHAMGTTTTRMGDPFLFDTCFVTGSQG